MTFPTPVRTPISEHLRALTTFSTAEKEKFMDVSEGIGGSETRDFLESVWHEEEIRLTEARKIFLPNPLVQLKTYPEDFCRKMRESGKYLSELLAILECAAEPGISPSDLENIARAFFYRHESAGILPAFPGTDGYPHAISVSKNDGIFHLPIDDVPFRDGDIVTIDSGVRWHWANTDAAVNLVIGNGSEAGRKLVAASRAAVSWSLSHIVPGGSAYGQAVFFYDSALSAGFRIIRDCNGHGVGESLHERPGIVHWPAECLKSLIFRPGNVFTVEPIFAERSSLSVSRWDGSAGFTESGDAGTYRELTVLVTENGTEVIAWIL